MSYGRGGAGNLAQILEPARRTPQDLEAQQPKPSNPEHQQAAASTASPTDQEYAHSGRGGAGNWYSPPALAAAGTFANSGDGSTGAVPRIVKAAESGMQATGRGGAGNFVWGAEGGMPGGSESRAKEEAMRTDIVREVEAGLAKPGRVVLKAEGVDDVVG